MKSLSTLASRPIFNKKGEGIATFGDGFESGVIFSIQVLRSAEITGEILFNTTQKDILLEHTASPFTIKGITKDGKRTFELENCFVVSTLEKSETINDKFIMKCSFNCTRVIIDQEQVNAQPDSDLIIRFGLVGIHKMIGVEVETPLGTLSLSQEEEIDNYEMVMEELGIPVITSQATFHIKADGSRTLQEILADAKRIIKNFLLVTSLAQTTWHRYAYVKINYALPASSKTSGHEILIEFVLPKSDGALPTNEKADIGESKYFIKNAWNGCSEEVLNKFGFDVALRWYIRSAADLAIELKLLCLVTALELLGDRFHKAESGESLIDDNTFQTIQRKIEVILTGELTYGNIEPAVQNEIKLKLNELNRRPFVLKVKRLLSHWGVRYDDLGLDPGEINEMRNHLVHMGSYQSTDDEDAKFGRAYLALFALLTRLFLAMLGYKGEYYDPAAQTLMSFSAVCTRAV